MMNREVAPVSAMVCVGLFIMTLAWCMQFDIWLAVKFNVTTVLSLSLLLSLIVKVAMEFRVGYDKLYVVTCFNEVTIMSFIAPHRHTVGYIALCTLWQNWWFAHSYSM